MRDLLTLSMPWWEFAVRGGLAYLGLLILMRLSGKRSFGEMAPFDIVVLIIVGGGMRTAIVAHDTSLLGPLIAVATILSIDRGLGRLATHSGFFSRLLEGTPTLLASKGRLIPGALQKSGIPDDAFERELRLHEVRSVDEVELAQLEATGRISVIRGGQASGRSAQSRD